MPAPTLIGHTVDHDRYRLIRFIGAGGMGEVYEAEDTQLPRRVAVKTIKRGLDDPAFARRFAREAMIIAQLDHPSIVKIYSYGSEQDFSYIVMQYLGGKSLADRLAATTTGERPQPSLADISTLIATIAAALDYAHKRGVIHRDVKPANIMYDEEGYAFLVDFGIARPSGGSGEDSIGLSRAYTPNYAAPEQVMLQRATPKIDQYALATVAYAMAAGGLPYEGNSEVVQEKKAQEDPLPASHFRPDLPRGLVDVLAKGLARNPEKRYPTAGAFAAAFASAAGAESGVGTKRGLWVGAAALVVAFVAVAGILTAALLPQTEQASPKASAEPQIAALAPVTSELIFLPDAVTPSASPESPAGIGAAPSATAPASTAASAQATATASPTALPASATPSPSQTPAPTTTATIAPSGTPDADATATELSARIQQTVEAALTATATSWTATPSPTPDLDATATWQERIIRETVEAQLTSIASQWTATPMATDTPVPSRTPRPTSTEQPSSTPTAGPRIIESCPELRASRLMIGDRGQVGFYNGAPINLRMGAGTHYPVLRPMSEGALFTVLGGPECSVYTWWHVRLDDGLEGWAAEGDPDRYFLDPLTAGAPPSVAARSAGSISIGDSVNGTLQSGEMDEWALYLPQTSILAISLTSPVFDTVLTVLDEQGGVVGRSDDGGEGTNSFINQQLSAGANYLIRVRAKDNRQGGAYSLSVVLGQAGETTRLQSRAVYVPFEHGFAIWTQSGDDVWLFYDTGIWGSVGEYFTTDPDINRDLQAPAGLLVPRSGIGIIWRATDGMNNLGWALQDEIGYTTETTYTAATGIGTVTGPNGEMYYLTNAYTWSR